MILRALACVVLLLLSISQSVTPATGLAFTWDPSGASPPLGGSAFTADSMTVANYLFGVVQPNGLTPEHLIQPIMSFQQSGSPVGVSGLGSTFGLYFNINAVFSTVGGAHFDNLDVRLLADRNADNGPVSSTLAGVGFSNLAGVANDVQLAHGTLITATVALDPTTGIRSAHFVDTFISEPGQAGFFVGPAGVPLALELNLTTLPDRFQALPQPDGSIVQLINNGAGTADLAPTPEPTTLALLGVTMAGLGLTVRWGRRRQD